MVSSHPPVDSVPVAASGLLTDVLGGSPVDGLVVAGGRLASYLTFPSRGGDAVLGVVTRQAVCPASGVVLPAGRVPGDLLPAGARVRLGDGVLEAPAHRLVVGRWFLPSSAPRRGTPCASTTAQARAALDARPVPAEVASCRADGALAAAALLHGDLDDALGRLVGLLGRGPGLTPSGDDVVAGVLLASRRLLDPERMERAGATVRRASRLATTVVARGMLADAVAGWCPDVVARALAALLTPAGPASSVAVADLLRTGHTSGGDLLAGAVAVLEAATRTQEVV